MIGIFTSFLHWAHRRGRDIFCSIQIRTIAKYMKKGYLIAYHCARPLGDGGILLSQVCSIGVKFNIPVFFICTKKDAATLLAFYPQIKSTYLVNKRWETIYYTQWITIVKPFMGRGTFFHSMFGYPAIPPSSTVFQRALSQSAFFVESYMPIQYIEKALCDTPYVIINLATKSSKNLSPSLLNPYVEKLIKAGYKVYENTNGMSHFDGCESIFPSFCELINYASAASLVVSVRSGILDFVAQTKAPILAIHTDNSSHDTRLYMRIAPLNHWRKSSVIEITESDLDSNCFLRSMYLLGIAI